MQKTDTHTVDLIAEQRLVVERRQDCNLLSIVGPDGVATLSVQVTAQGPVLHLTGARLRLVAEGNLDIEAREVAIHGREGLTLTTGGDVKIEASGNLHSSACAQSMRAEWGNVDIHANDDVKIDGERIRMNC